MVVVVEPDQIIVQSAAAQTTTTTTTTNNSIPSRGTMLVREQSVPVVLGRSHNKVHQCNLTMILQRWRDKSWIYEKDENQVHATSSSDNK